MNAPTEDELLRELGARPGDAELRLVYADWLEERGQAGKAAFLRVQLEMAKLGPDDPRLPMVAIELQRALQQTDAAWRAAVAQLRLENCVFVVPCPARWESLGRTSDPRVRTCGACRRDVHYCTSVDELRRRTAAGDCVVVDVAVPRLLGGPEELLPTAGVVAVPDVPPPLPERERPVGLWGRVKKLFGG